MDTRPSELTVADFIGELASDRPAPGGGSASALAGAMAAALVRMAVELTTGRPDAAEAEGDLREIGLAAAGFQSELLQLVDIDATAYGSVIAARRLPRETDRERDLRRVQIDAAVREATRSPLTIADRAAKVLTLAERVAPIGNRNAISDVGVAAVLAATAVRGAALNVRINLPALPDEDSLRGEASERLDEMLAGLEERESALRSVVDERLG